RRGDHIDIHVKALFGPLAQRGIVVGVQATDAADGQFEFFQRVRVRADPAQILAGRMNIGNLVVLEQRKQSRNGASGRAADNGLAEIQRGQQGIEQAVGAVPIV